MSKAFLELVAEHLHSNYKDNIDKLCIVLPNRRAAIFLKQHLARAFGQTIWLPSIISAEELIAELSGLQVLDEIDLMCHLFDCYQSVHKEKAESFESFSRWGQLILQDFNEVDRYMADPVQLYENLKDIKEIENWSLGADVLSAHQSNYLAFMQSLGAIYKLFNERLHSRAWAYQGMAYKKAATNCLAGHFQLPYYKLIFCGFNAFNHAETVILQQLLQEKKAEVLWDADSYYVDREEQEAGSFLRKNFRQFGSRRQRFIGDHFSGSKDIRVVSVPKQMGQAQVLRQCLEELIEKNVPLDQVAVVLANERLLWPVLQQLPPSVEAVNITMEYPLKYTGSYILAELLLKIQYDFSKQRKKAPAIYHKDLVALLRQPMFQWFSLAMGLHVRAEQAVEQINTHNIAFAGPSHLERLFGNGYKHLATFLQPAPVKNWCLLLRDQFEKMAGGSQAATRPLENEALFILIKSLNRLLDLLERYSQFREYGAFRQLFLQVVGNMGVAFIGEPLRGLQVMGVLETRALDFPYLILLNVNEGILPSGKSNNSFIPNDLKKAFGMPLYQEKDAVYAYHFYRLLQRAQQVTITVDSETDTFGKAERSRFVTQLQLELSKINTGIKIREMVAEYSNFSEKEIETISVKKTPEVLSEILSKAMSADKYGGLSPSGLISFRECSLRFYFRYGLHLKEPAAVEESAEAGTFGTILHQSLENLYKNYLDQPLSVALLAELRSRVSAEVANSFALFFDNSEPSGKSLLQLEVINVYINRLIDAEKKLLQNSASLSVLKLEEEYSSTLAVTLEGRPETVIVKGKIDRIDRLGNKVRLIDYKSSIKEGDKFIFDGFEKLLHDKNYSKQFQLFTYAWLLYKNKHAVADLQPCIIAFKSFSQEPRLILTADKKPLTFTNELLAEFEKELARYIEGILTDEGTFEQTADLDNCGFCAYRGICNIND